MKFIDLLEAKKVKKPKQSELPKIIAKAEHWSYDKKSGIYEYVVIEPYEFGDYGDEGEEYNQGETFHAKYNITKEGKIVLSAEILDLSRTIHRSTSKKYNGKEYDTVVDFVKDVEKFFKDFEKVTNY